MRYEPPSRQIVFEDADVAAALDRALRDFWVGQAILITDAAADATPLAQAIRAALGSRLFDRLSGFSGPVSRSSIMQITRALRSREIDAAVVFGDAQLIETVKAARICLTNNVVDETDMERLRVATTAATPRPYLVVIPSDAGTAPYSVQLDLPARDSEPGFVLRHQYLAADVVILSPEATAHIATEGLISGGRGALAQALAAQDELLPRPVLAAVEYGQRHLVGGADALRRVDDATARAAFLGAAWLAAQATASVGVPTHRDGRYQTQAAQTLAAMESVPSGGDE